MKIVRFNIGLGWYVFDSKSKRIVASQFDSRDEAEMWVNGEVK